MPMSFPGSNESVLTLLPDQALMNSRLARTGTEIVRFEDAYTMALPYVEVASLGQPALSST